MSEICHTADRGRMKKEIRNFPGSCFEGLGGDPRCEISPFCPTASDFACLKTKDSIGNYVPSVPRRRVGNLQRMSQHYFPSARRTSALP